MGRLTEAIHLASATPKEWTKYSTDAYLHHVSFEEAKKVREALKRQKDV